MNIKRILFIIVVIVFSFQNIPAQTKAVKKAERNAARVERREYRAFLKSQKKGKKEHYNMQSEKTKIMMKESAKRSKENNKKRINRALFNKCNKRRKVYKRLR